MIINFPRIEDEKLKNKIIDICKNESIKYTNDGLEALIFYSNYDIRQCINNLECILYTFNDLTKETVYNLIDKPKIDKIKNILLNCKNKDLVSSLKLINELHNNGHSSSDILLSFLNYIQKGDIEYLNEEEKLKLYDITSRSYIKVNNGINTLLQLYGCIANIHIFI